MSSPAATAGLGSNPATFVVGWLGVFVSCPGAGEAAARAIDNRAGNGNGKRRMGRGRFTVQSYSQTKACFNQKTLCERIPGATQFLGGELSYAQTSASH
jgi:hypothetical protein